MSILSPWRALPAVSFLPHTWCRPFPTSYLSYRVSLTPTALPIPQGSWHSANNLPLQHFVFPKETHTAPPSPILTGRPFLGGSRVLLILLGTIDWTGLGSREFVTCGSDSMKLSRACAQRQDMNSPLHVRGRGWSK